MTLIPDTDQAPGYCSVATPPLTNEQVARIVSAATTKNDVAGISVQTEKELVGSGNRKLYIIETTDKIIVVEYAGVRKAKFVKKDLERYQAMMNAYDDEDAAKEVTFVLLLKEDGTICRRNTLPALHRDGVVVMRVNNDDESDSDSSSDSDSD
jgi:hypothetical protein